MAYKKSSLSKPITQPVGNDSYDQSDPSKKRESTGGAPPTQ